jgi:hypothetical protein
VVRIVHQYPTWNGDPETVLEYHGMRFHHLISHSYAVTPDHKAVIFATQRAGAVSVLHYLPLGAGAPIDVGLGDSGFGAGLGYPEDDRSADYIEGVNGDTLLLAARYGGGTQLRHYTLNLDKRSFAAVAAAGDAAP